MKKDLKKLFVIMIIISVLFPILAFVVYSLLNGNFGIKLHIPTAIAYLFIGGGVILSISRIIKVIVSNRQCSERVTAVCSDMHMRTSDTDGGSMRLYRPVFEYYYNGLTYESSPKEDYTNIGLPDIGQECKIKVNPFKPEQIYYPSIKLFCVYVFSGLFFIFFGIIILSVFPMAGR